MIVPIKVRGVSSTAICSGKNGSYGTIQIETGDKNAGNGKGSIELDSKEKVVWTKNPVSLKVSVKAKKHNVIYQNLVDYVDYKIISGEGDSGCTARIPQSAIKDNKGQVILNFNINNGYVKEIMVSAGQYHPKFDKTGIESKTFPVRKHNGQNKDNMKLGCIQEYGNMELLETGKDIDVVGGANGSTTYKWLEKNKKFELVVKAHSGWKVSHVNYYVKSSGDTVCKGTLEGKLLAYSEGSATFHYTITNNDIDKIIFYGVENKMNDTDKHDEAGEAEIEIDSDGQGSAEDNDNASGSGVGSDLGDLVPNEGVKCDEEISKLIIEYWGYITFLLPLILLIMITIDFVKAMSVNDADSIKKASNAAFKRVLAAVILLATPWIVNVVFTWFGLESFLCF